MTAPSMSPGFTRVMPVGADGLALTGLATDHGKAEDAAHSTGDKGFQSLGVYRAAPTQDAGTAGDYTHPIFDTKGKEWTNPEKTGHYETVAASQTDQILGATGAAGDYLDKLIITVATAATGAVSITDGNGSAIPILPNSPGGGVGVYVVPIEAYCVNATTPGWKVTTGAGSSVLAIGRFT